MRFPKVLANQRPVDIDFVALDDGVGTRIELFRLSGHMGNLTPARPGGWRRDAATVGLKPDLRLATAAQQRVCGGWKTDNQ